MRGVTSSNNSHVSSVRPREDNKIQTLPPESAMGTAAARELVAQLRKELLPGHPISRSEFLNLPLAAPLDAREEKRVDLKTMVGLIIGAWALEKSIPIRSMNHKSSAGDDYHTAREAIVEFQEFRAPKEGESDILRGARQVSFTPTGRCGLHADRNFCLVASMLHRLSDDDQYHALADYLPHVEKMEDKTAGERLGGPPDDDHAYVRIAGMADPVIVDSWVLFPKVHVETQGKYEGGLPVATYQLTVNKHDVHDRRGDKSRPARLAHRSSGAFGTPHANALNDAKEAVYVCGELKFDPDLMSASGLQLRKTWAQEAAVALAIGGEQSPIRGAPRLSPLARPDAAALPSDVGKSIAPAQCPRCQTG